MVLVFSNICVQPFIHLFRFYLKQSGVLLLFCELVSCMLDARVGLCCVMHDNASVRTTLELLHLVPDYTHCAGFSGETFFPLASARGCLQ